MKILKIRHVLLIAVSVIFLLNAPSAHAEKTPAETYLALRKSCNATQISPTELRNNILSYVGKTVELCGTVNGKASSEASVTFMINCGDDNALISCEKEIPECIADGAKIRVLASVPTGTNLGSYTLVAACYDYEVEALEKKLAPKPKSPATKKEVSRDLTNSAFITARQTAGSNLSSRAMKIYDPYKKAIAQFNPRLTEQELDTITKSLLSCSEKYGVDPRLVVALILAESSFRPNAKSRAGAMGLGQLMPGTASGMGVDNAYDTEQNINACVRLISSHLKKYKDLELALAAYNAGAGAVKKYGGVPPYKETQNYVKKVTAIYKQLCGYK